MKYFFIFLAALIPFNLKSEENTPTPPSPPDSFTYVKLGSFPIMAPMAIHFSQTPAAIPLHIGLGRRHHKADIGWDYSLNYYGYPLIMPYDGIISAKGTFLKYFSEDPTSGYVGIGLEGGVYYDDAEFQLVPYPNVELILGKEFYSSDTKRRKFVQIGVNTLPIIEGFRFREPLAYGILTTSLTVGVSF